MTPRNSLVLVEVHPRTEHRIGEIVLPTETHRNYDYATIVAVGRGHYSNRDGDGDSPYYGCEDLEVGAIVVVKTSNPTSQNPRHKSTLTFQCAGKTLEMVNEQDVISILASPEEAQDLDLKDIESLIDPNEPLIDCDSDSPIVIP